MNSADTFESWWPHYPRKVAKRDAQKAWTQLMKRGVNVDQIYQVLRWRMDVDWKGRETSFIPYPASFLRGEEFDTPADRPILKLAEPKSHRHICLICRPPHDWECFNDSLFCDDECKSAIDSMH